MNGFIFGNVPWKLLVPGRTGELAGFAVITQSDIHLLPWKDLECLWDPCLPLITLLAFFWLEVWLRTWEWLSVVRALVGV